VAFQRGLELEPDNRVFRNLMNKAKELSEVRGDAKAR
jgi:hypothetical protein